MNGAITLISLAIALAYGGVCIQQYELGFEILPWTIAIYFDPILVAWDETNTIPGSSFSIGPVVVIEERWRETEREEYLLRHEINHVRQWYALGWGMWPAHWLNVLTIEPRVGVPDWEHPEENDQRMWLPGRWPRWAHFLTLRVGLGR